MTVRDTEKYRRRNPAQTIPELGEFNICAVIPCYNENETLGATLNSLKESAEYSSAKVAVLVVVNYPAGGDETDSLELFRRINAREFSSLPCFAIYAPGLKGGVGEARKIGMDSFLQSLPAEQAPGCS